MESMRQPSELFGYGTRVRKISGKPFKSGLQFNTVKSVVDHPHKINPETGKAVPAYTFFEDDSIVEAAAVRKVTRLDVKGVDPFSMDGLVMNLMKMEDGGDTPAGAAVKGICIGKFMECVHSDRINYQSFLLSMVMCGFSPR